MNLSIIIFKSGNRVVHLPPVHEGGSPVGAIIGRQLVIIDGNEKRWQWWSRWPDWWWQWQENLASNPIGLWCEKTLPGLPVGLTRRDVPGFKSAPGGWWGMGWSLWRWWRSSRISIFLCFPSNCDHQESICCHNLGGIVDDLEGSELTIRDQDQN